MIYHENRLLADHSHEISYLIFFKKLGKMLQNFSSAAVVIGVLRVKDCPSTQLVCNKLYVPSLVHKGNLVQ